MDLRLPTAMGLVVMLPAALAAQDSGAAQAPGPLVRVAPVNGALTFTVDGQPFMTPCFETYCPEERYFRQFAETGVRLFSFSTNAAACDYGHSRPTWVAPEVYDYSQFDELMARVLAVRPDALVMPRVNLGTPDWWLAAHPGEMEVLDDGATLYREPNRNPTLPKGRPFPSLASEKWRGDIGEALRRLILHIQQSPYADRIFGYFLTGLDTEEWYPWSSGSDHLSGYSAPTQAAFRDWLRARYSTDEALQAAWGTAAVTLDTAQVPAAQERFDQAQGTFRDLARAMNVVDFYLFYNDLVAETIDHFAAVARQVTGGRKAIGAFYGYLYEFGGDPEYGHNAMARYSRSPNLDFIFVTASYAGRAAGSGGDYLRGPAGSMSLHGKLWYHDNDVVSYLAPQVMSRAGLASEGDWSRNLDHYLNVLGYTDSAERTRWMYRRSMGFALCNGAYESYFDLHGGYYDDPALMDEVAWLNRVAEAAAQTDRSSISRILVVADEASCSYLTFRNGALASMLRDTQLPLVKLGAPVDHILADDLTLVDPNRYRLVVFLNTFHLTGTQRAAARRFMDDGRTLLWCYAPGYAEGNRLSAEAMAQLTGMDIRPADSREAVPLTIRALDDTLAPAGTVLGSEGCRAQLFTVSDPAARPLGLHPVSGEVVMAERDMGAWRSVYTVTPVLSPAVYRVLARRAGVHIFSDADDTFYADRSMLALHADGAGPRRLRFPAPAWVRDALTAELLAEAAESLTLRLEHGETRLLRWGLADGDAR